VKKYRNQEQEALSESRPQLSAAETKALARLVRKYGIRTVIALAKVVPLRRPGRPSEKYRNQEQEGVVIARICFWDLAQMLLAQCDDMVTHSRRVVPINLSAKQFCHGEPGAMRLSRIPMARNRRVTAAP
jgi:hypothetical protein